MADYVDIDKAIVVTDTRGRERKTTVRQILDLNKGVYEAAEVQPVRHGRWNVYSAKHGLYSCSECHCVPAFLHSPYCPNCGAIMDKEEE